MEQFRWAAGRLTLPLNAFLALWTASAGWSVGFAVLFLGGWLLPSTLLCLVRIRKAGELTTAMALAQTATWAGFLLFGLTAVEGAGEPFPETGDQPRSRWTDLVGWSAGGAESSETVARLALAAALTAWLALFVLLVLDARRRLVSEPVADDRPTPTGPASRRGDLRERQRLRTRRDAVAKH
ncbi:hypothetical protein [Segniliparus rugosus]|uniref:Transmembrane protein n=1 Tax=Segniliparus rugosus (strain ATCC BAA-974 / DSM 45345 / CCUG 50838 / CIP 108380 / JCM 13579 / CDC 945) TaxID=679197 RepID=E5XQS8_SEGRC|nr:hypothetical protein [Segniliparus rugosus]EFV13301.1 hypothetical protein HMPREF9336_01850 [Segniliparus rugosus ATCC BAA-974]